MQVLYFKGYSEIESEIGKKVPSLSDFYLFLKIMRFDCLSKKCLRTYYIM